MKYAFSYENKLVWSGPELSKLLIFDLIRIFKAFSQSESRTPGVRSCRRSRFLLLTKTITASGDENGMSHERSKDAQKKTGANVLNKQ